MKIKTPNQPDNSLTWRRSLLAFLTFCVAITFSVVSLSAETTYQVDFGLDTQKTTDTGWNNLTGPSGGNPTNSPLSLVDSSGASSSVTLSYAENALNATGTGFAGTGANYTGTYPAAVSSLPANALKDGFYFQNANNGITLTLNGLNSSVTYDFLFYGARGNNGSSTSFTVTGLNTTNGSIANVLNNSTAVVVLTNIAPNAGVITVAMTGPTATSTAAGACNLMVMTETANIYTPPAPPSASTNNGAWILDGNGNWSSTNNWQGNNVAFGIGKVAALTNDLTANRTITIDTSAPFTNGVILGAMTIGDTTGDNYSFTLASSAGGKLTFDQTGSADAILDCRYATVYNGPLVNPAISVPIVLNDNLVITNGDQPSYILEVSGGISDGAGSYSVSKYGGGFLRISSVAGTYDGGTYVYGGSIRNDGTANAFGTGPVVIASGGQFYALAAITNVVSIAGIGPFVSAQGGNLGALRLNTTLSAPITLTDNARITTYAASGYTMSSTISGPYELEIGTGGTNFATTLTLSGTANTTAATRITQASPSFATTVIAANGTCLSTGPLYIDGGTLRLNGQNLSFARLTNNPAGNCSIVNNHATTAATLTLGSDNSSFSYSGALNDGAAAPLALTKVGAGILTLSGINNLMGTTTVSNGTLALSGSGTLQSGTITVVSGAGFNVSAVSGGYSLGSAQTLKGDGTVVGPLNVSGTLAAGASIGTLTISGGATLAGTVVAEIANGPSADLLNFTGGATLGGTLTVTNTGAPLISGQTFNLFDGSLSGTFATVNLPGGSIHWNTANLYSSGEITFANSTPIAAAFDLGVAVGDSVTASVVGKHATDADVGDVLTIISVSAPANGTVNIVGGTNLLYTSTNTAASDSFTYTVSDGLTSATGTITVTTYSAEGFNLLSGPVDNGNGTYTINYLGVPNAAYALETTSTLTPPSWTAIQTNTASGTGALSFTFPTGEGQGYFRTHHLP